MNDMKITVRLLFICASILSTLAYAEVHKCVINGVTTYSQKECPPPIIDEVATNKLNNEAAFHGASGFLDPTGGKNLTCVEAEEFNKSHDRTKTMAACMISGKQASERARKDGRDIMKTTWIDACVEGSCRVGVWRDVD